jgi:lipid-binding SYLF domain-containing protein
MLMCQLLSVPELFMSLFYIFAIFGIIKSRRKQNTMKTKTIFFSLFLFLLSMAAFAGKTDENVKESKQIIQEFKQKDPGMTKFFNTAYGYVVFPHIGKGGFGVGGASGKGTVFKQGKPVAHAKMVQFTIGLQAGGQKYAEVIFFQNKEAYDRFTGNHFEFAAQISAVALKEGVSRDADYRDGMLVFTKAIGGLMYEASIGGQKFKVKFY